MSKIEFMVRASGKGTATTANTGKHDIVIDASQETGPNPLETLLSTLAACENGTAHAVAEEMYFDLQGIAFKINGEVDSRGVMGDPNVRPYFEKVEIEAVVQTTESEERLNELQQVVESRCPLYGIFKAANVQMVDRWVKAE